MARILAIIFGIGFVFLGVAGFLPTFTQDSLLFGYFTSDVMTNVIRLIIGVIAIMAATSYLLSRRFFQLLGLVLVIAAIWGFWKQGDLYIIHVSLADNIAHIILGVLALLIGFAQSKEER